ncbi:MAG TPA: N-acetylmannosamine-6-phosphate 2-epimerase [Chloroflexota bacterium]|nr:N-acetylmannosamine-6-phosphate 2-epimerase [Chloroflexota bacterium]
MDTEDRTTEAAREPAGARGARADLASLRGGLVVSCQARGGNPLRGPTFMAAMARAAVMGGAAGIRANGPDDIAAVRRAVDVPIIGILKVTMPDGSLFITPSPETVRAVIAAGSRLVALDGTGRARAGGATLRQVIDTVHAESACALADISTEDEGLHAADCGADAVGTTLSGYTPYSRRQAEPDLVLVERLASRLDIPVFAEGRIATPGQVRQAFEAGAAFVVVGTAITDIVAVTRAFVRGVGPGRAEA